MLRPARILWIGLSSLVLLANQAEAQPSRPSGGAAPVQVTILNKDNWNDFAPAGKEVDAIYGDIVIRNGEITAVIAAPSAKRHANMTVRDAAGCLIDLTRRDIQSDQLSCYYPGQRRFPYRSWKGTDDADKPLELATLNYQGRSACVLVMAETAEGQPAVETRYCLTTGQPWLEIATTFTNPHNAAITIPLVDDVRIDGTNEDMQKSPDGVHDLFTVVDNYWQQAYGVVSPGGDERKIQTTNERASILKFVAADGHDSVTLQPGDKYRLERRIVPGRNLFEVRANLGQPQTADVSKLTLTFRDGAERPISHARFEMSTADGQPLGVAIANSEGTFTIPIPHGDYTGTLKALGVVIGDAFTLTLHDRQQHETLTVARYRPGTVVAKITDAHGQPIPCKVEFVAENKDSQPNFGPITAENGVRNLYYSPTGEFHQPLPPGKYKVAVSHGPEYDAIFTTLEVPPGGEAPLTGKLVRSVDTTGWISSDFHSHSSPSGDNTASQRGRVINLLCEHVEFCPCTEHNRISSYVPHIEELKIAKFMGTCSGMELTGSPLPLNHQNAFPLREHPHEQDGGGPVTDGDPAVQIERLALWDDRSDKLVQQNHPDIGWLFYDKNGDGQPDEGYSHGFGFMDVIEVHPLDYALKLPPTWKYNDKTYNHALFNWLQLINQGRIITGVVNTDAHYNFHGSGSLRNWIASPTDDPADVKPLDIVHASEDGRLVMSNGPFLTMAAVESGKDAAVGVGGTLVASSGKLRVYVKVQCANWLDIDTVQLLINGRISDAHRFTREKHPQMFGDSAVKFLHPLDVELPGDAHIVAIAGSEKPMGTSIYGLESGGWRSAAVTNPIFVDVDGSGFTPNKDTLGAPLPVKGAD